MDISLIILAFIIAFLATLLFKYIKSKTNTSTYVDVDEKKNEIIKNYENLIRKELLEVEKNQRKQKKLELIKYINSELSRNIYFEKNEIKPIINRLIAIEV